MKSIHPNLHQNHLFNALEAIGPLQITAWCSEKPIDSIFTS
jgi:hypothetical protein